MRGIIIGFGNMGQTHFERYQQLNVLIPAIVETDHAKAKLAKSKGSDVYAELSAIPHIEGYDFIDICTPTHLHHLHIKQAMTYKKPLFVEKPLVLSREHVADLRKTDYKNIIFVGEVEHYNPKLAPLLNYNAIPKNISIKRMVNLDFFLQGTTSWFLDESQSGGIVMDLMIHDLNLLISKYGKPTIKKVKAETKKHAIPDEVSVLLGFQGFDAELFACWTLPKKQKPIVVTISIKEKKAKTKTIVCNNYAVRAKSNEEDPFYRELHAFIQSISINKQSYPLTPYLDALDVALDIRQAIQKKK